jgi:RimJ/RimL family protein N-acetyltransferase
MRFVVYRQNDHETAVIELFRDIYPGWTMDECATMAYDETLPPHHLTLLASTDESLAGQLNVFRVAPKAELGNIGFHVHPRWRRIGVAASLLYTAWEAIAGAFADGLVIQTEKDNEASINLAVKAGFRVAGPDITEKYQDCLKYQYHRDGVCFHRPKSGRTPEISLEISAAQIGHYLW